MKRRSSKLTPKKLLKKNDLVVIFFLPILLTLIGLVFIFEASSIGAFRSIGDSLYYIRLQAVWFLIGIGMMIFFSLFDYHKLYYLSFPFLMGSIILLVLVLIPGIGQTVSGARRWINLGYITIQPTEFAKFSSILYLCSWFLYKEHKRFFSFFLLLIFIISLIMVQPDMGTAIIIFSVFVIIYFLAGVDLHYLIFLIPFSLFSFVLLVKISPYRFRRFMSFLNPDLDPLGITYHVNQILISLSSGGLFGRGFSESRQKYLFLPEAHTDSIFAILGEEFGFIGGVMLIGIYALLLYKCFRIAQSSKDRFGFLLGGAILSLLACQIIINLGGMVNLIPLTGVPLPFISYGGSSLVVFFALMGIMINIGRR